MKNDAKIIAMMLKYRKISTPRMVFDICVGWLQILIFLAVFMWVPVWWTFVPIFIIIGSRQYSLLILLHDAQHTLLHSNRKVNDRVATWLLAAPFGVIFTKSRLNHMLHHQNLGGHGQDPDFPLYCIKEPEPKDTLARFLAHFMRQIFWGKLIRVFLPNNKAKISKNDGLAARNSTHIVELLVVLVCQMVIFGAFMFSGFWYGYFLLWLLPLVMVATFLNDSRIFCEHSNPQDEKNKGKGLLVSYISNPLERFFFSPHDMNYHAEHHFFPFIPHYNLPEVRSIVEALPEYQKQIQWRLSYCGHIRNYIKSINIFYGEHSLSDPSSETN